MRRRFCDSNRRPAVESLEPRAYFTASFAEPVSVGAPASPQGIATGDFNEDSFDDLAVTSFFQGAVTVFLGNGQGTFTAQTPLTASANLSGITVADVTGKGHQDLIAVGDSVTLFKGRGDGSFENGTILSTGGSPQMAAAGNFDADDDLDLAVPNTADASISIFTNNGTGVFTKTTITSIATPYWISTEDLDFDGDIDLVEANLGAADQSGGFIAGSVATFLNDGSGAFTLGNRYNAGLHPVGVDIADVNNDGNLDVVSANGGLGESPRGSDDVSVLLGNGDGTLQPAVNYPAGAQAPQAIKIFDIDNDGSVDLITANNLSGNVSVLSGNGDGTFTAALNFASGSGNSQLTLLDANGDGKTDIATTVSNASNLALLLNNAAPADALPAVADAIINGPPAEGDTAFDFTVTYNDDQQLDTDSFGDDDIVVNGLFDNAQGGAGDILPVTLVNVDSSDPTSATVTYRLAAPGGTFDAADAGTYTFTVSSNSVADSMGQSVVSAQIGSFTLNFSPKPDLSAQVVSPVPTVSLVGGAKGTAAIRITDNGSAALTGTPFQIQLYLSTDTTFDDADLPLGGPVTSNLKLKPTIGKVVKFKFNYPDAGNGSYHVLAQLDPTGAVDEADETNNTAATDATVNVAPAFIDLQVGPITSPAGAIPAGKRAAAAVLLTNLGNVPFGGSATVELFASTDGVIDDADVKVASVTKVQRLKAGKAKPIKVKLDTSALVAGTYMLVARLTSSGLLPDNNPANDVVSAGNTFSIG